MRGRNHTSGACGTQTRSSSGIAFMAISEAARAWADPVISWYMSKLLAAPSIPSRAVDRSNDALTAIEPVNVGNVLVGQDEIPRFEIRLHMVTLRRCRNDHDTPAHQPR